MAGSVVYGVPDGRKERREEIVPRAPLLNGVSVCVCVWYRLLMVLGGYLALSGGVFRFWGGFFCLLPLARARRAHTTTLGRSGFFMVCNRSLSAISIEFYGQPEGKWITHTHTLGRWKKKTNFRGHPNHVDAKRSKRLGSNKNGQGFNLV